MYEAKPARELTLPGHKKDLMSPFEFMLFCLICTGSISCLHHSNGCTQPHMHIHPIHNPKKKKKKKLATRSGLFAVARSDTEKRNPLCVVPFEFGDIAVFPHPQECAMQKQAKKKKKKKRQGLRCVGWTSNQESMNINHAYFFSFPSHRISLLLFCRC